MGIFKGQPPLTGVLHHPHHTTSLLFRAISLSLALSQLAAAQNIINVNSPATSIDDNTVIPSGSTVIVSDGGSIGLGVDLSNGILLIEGGTVAEGNQTFPGGFSNFTNEVRITGGRVGAFFQLGSGTTLDLSGGEIESFGIFNGSTADVFSGTITRFPDILNGGVARIYGGDVSFLRVFGGGEAHLFGSQFAINGQLITGLTPNEAREITNRNVTLSGILSDGSPFSFDLNTNFGDFSSNNPNGASLAADITVSLVSELGTPTNTIPSEVDFTSPRSGTIRVSSQLNHSYRLRRTTDLPLPGAIIASQAGTGGELQFSFDDSSSDAERAFFFVEEVAEDP